MANVVVVGAQWGDEGKGKVVDALTASADVVVRCAGGANAGHTLVYQGERLVVHLLPSGVVHPEKQCLLGAGMVIDPKGLLEEIQTCRARGLRLEPDTLGVSQTAHVILPYHMALDGLKDRGENAIGTTRRGIGPCYEDKMARRGVQMWQLARRETLHKALEKALPPANALLERFGEPAMDSAELLDTYAALGAELAPFLCDTSLRLHERMEQGANILFEGAQGALLDIDYGTYPFVTSSNTIAGGACTGAGVGPTRIDRVIGIVKAYLTRVGNGPFPTELHGPLGEQIRATGDEYGATTGRPRRCGWLDAVALRRAARVNGLTGLAVTKLDVLTGIHPLRICVGYRLDGEPRADLPPDVAEAERLEPEFEELPGFDDDIRAARKWADLPSTARAYLTRMSELANVPIRLVSVGPGRDETILLDNPFGDG